MSEELEVFNKLAEAEAIPDFSVPFTGNYELDQKIVQALVDKVVVYDPRHVEIRWKFSDEVLKLLQE